ncbi:MAG: hypothetical protein LBG57_12760, partial [Treponema sp.]|nr:hypothetical protein [Treponema sp.]
MQIFLQFMPKRLAAALRTPASRSAISITSLALFKSLKTRKQGIQTAVKLFVKRHFFIAGSQNSSNKRGHPCRIS